LEASISDGRRANRHHRHRGIPLLRRHGIHHRRRGSRHHRWKQEEQSSCAARNRSEAPSSSVERSSCAGPSKNEERKYSCGSQEDCNCGERSSCGSEHCNCRTSGCCTTEKCRSGFRRCKRSAGDSRCCCGPALWSSCGSSCCRPRADDRYRWNEPFAKRPAGCCCRSPAGRGRNRWRCPGHSKCESRGEKHCY